jgi:hypothetical protein
MEITPAVVVIQEGCVLGAWSTEVVARIQEIEEAIVIIVAPGSGSLIESR